MDKVWVVKTNGQSHEEVFPNTQDAINYAKQVSLRAMCAVRNQGKLAIFYEQGEQADAKRSKELTDAVVEILEHENERFAKQGRGRASRKKVG